MWIEIIIITNYLQILNFDQVMTKKHGLKYTKKNLKYLVNLLVTVYAQIIFYY